MMTNGYSFHNTCLRRLYLFTSHKIASKHLRNSTFELLELVYIFYLITPQLHLIFNNNKKEVVSCLINHLIHQSWLWVIFGCFEMAPQLKDLWNWGSLRNVTLTLKNSEEFQIHLGIEKKKRFKSHYFAIQPHTFSYLLPFHCLEMKLTWKKHSKCIKELCSICN